MGPFLLIRLKKIFTGALQHVQKISHQVNQEFFGCDIPHQQFKKSFSVKFKFIIVGLKGFSHMVLKNPGAAARLLHRV